VYTGSIPVLASNKIHALDDFGAPLECEMAACS